MSERKLTIDESMTGSIVFAADDDDDDDGSNCSDQSADDVSRPDVRRGILRNATNNLQHCYIDERHANLPTSSPGGSNRQVPEPMLQGEPGIFWPDCEIVKQQNQNPASRTTGNEANRTESHETHDTGNNAVAARKKLTVRFSPEADDARVAGSGQGMRRPSDEFRGHVQSHAEQVQGHTRQVQGRSERRRLNIGRIAENKFNDGRNPVYISDISASMTKTDSSKSNRKWYHFSFRSNKNREKDNAKVESQLTAAVQPMYAEPISVDEEAKIRCRGRREMRENSSHQVTDADNEYVKTLAAQGYRLLSSVSEPEQLGGHGRREGSSTQPVFSASSAYDLRRSPTVIHDGHKSRGTAVRRSRTTVGDDRHRQPMRSSTPGVTILPARRSSTDLVEYTLPATTQEITTIVNDPGAFSTPTCNNQQGTSGWYYGLNGALDRQVPATTHDVAYYLRQTQHLNLSTSVESLHDVTQKSDARCRPVAATGGDVVWSGQSWTTPRQLRTSTTAVERERNRNVMMSNGETAHHEVNSIFGANHEINPVFSSDVASNYILRRESLLPVTRLHSQNLTLEKHWNIVGRGLPEIRVTPATYKLRDRPKVLQLLFPEKKTNIRK